MTAFQALGLARTLAAVKEHGYEVPTPIQALVLPQVRSTDLIGLASTGTGKTAAYALAIIEDLVDRQDLRPGALVLVPTRELAVQVQEEFARFTSKLGLTAGCVIGQMPIEPQRDELKANIVVATPGRLLDFLQRGWRGIENIRYLVLDEFDRILDLGFRADIERIRRYCPRPDQRRTLLFSATLPDELRRYAETWLNSGKTFSAQHTEPLTQITHHLIEVKKDQRFAALRYLLAQDQAKGEQTLVFFRARFEVRKVAKLLAECGVKAGCMSGAIGQSKRLDTFRRFRAGTLPVLLATDIAQRGLDIEGIKRVISYGAPPNEDAYCHRSGRTGRAAKTGDSILIVTPDDRESLEKITRRLAVRFNPMPIPEESLVNLSILSFRAERNPVFRYQIRTVAATPAPIVPQEPRVRPEPSVVVSQAKSSPPAVLPGRNGVFPALEGVRDLVSFLEAQRNDPRATIVICDSHSVVSHVAESMRQLQLSCGIVDGTESAAQLCFKRLRKAGTPTFLMSEDVHTKLRLPANVVTVQFWLYPGQASHPSVPSADRRGTKQP